MQRILVTVCIAVASSATTLFLLQASFVPEALAQPQVRRAQLPPGVFNADGLTSDEAIGVYVYDRNNRSVANITTRTVRTDGFFAFESDDEGAGSGAVLDRQGHVLTNYHVIEDARRVKATLYNGVTYDAVVVGADPINDTAVIRLQNVPPEELFPAQIGDSARLKVGMRVYAIGNPFGLERTMTTGIISSLNRTLRVTPQRSIKSIIQIDAAINPGNSGGPLLDSRGELIGMNTAIATGEGSRQNAGIGFAIPINLIQRIVPQLIKYGRVIRPEIGIQRVFETEDGLLITQLKPGGAAEQAGLRGPEITTTRRGGVIYQTIARNKADLIVAVDGRKTESVDEFLSYIESKKPGDEVTVTVRREGQLVNVAVTLSGNVPADGK